VKHVVVIVQENRTIDNLFNGYPGADTVAVDPYTHRILQPASLTAACDIDHEHQSFVTDFDGGAMDGFDRNSRSCPTAYAFVPQSETPRYFQLARHNVLADETFQSNQGPSLPAHQYLYAGRSCSYPGDRYCLAEKRRAVRLLRPGPGAGESRRHGLAVPG
jgi:phospholipase C